MQSRTPTGTESRTFCQAVLDRPAGKPRTIAYSSTRYFGSARPAPRGAICLHDSGSGILSGNALIVGPGRVPGGSCLRPCRIPTWSGYNPHTMKNVNTTPRPAHSTIISNVTGTKAGHEFHGRPPTLSGQSHADTQNWNSIATPT